MTKLIAATVLCVGLMAPAPVVAQDDCKWFLREHNLVVATVDKSPNCRSLATGRRIPCTLYARAATPNEPYALGFWHGEQLKVLRGMDGTVYCPNPSVQRA